MHVHACTCTRNMSSLYCCMKHVNAGYIVHELTGSIQHVLHHRDSTSELIKFK